VGEREEGEVEIGVTEDLMEKSRDGGDGSGEVSVGESDSFGSSGRSLRCVEELDESQELERGQGARRETHRSVHHTTDIVPLWRDRLDLSLRLPQRFKLLQAQNLHSILSSELRENVVRGLSVVDNDLEGRTVVDDLEDHGEEIAVGEDGSNRGLIDSVGESSRSEGIVGSAEGS